MKKLALLLLMICLATAACAAALAEDDALELTLTSCQYNLSGVKNPKNLTDRKFTTNSESKSVKNPTLTISSSEPIYGLYLCFQKKPESYEIQVKRDGDWETLQEGSAFYHAFYALEGADEVRVYALGEKKQTMGFNEVYVFGEGRIPGWVQRWRPTPEKSDILFVVAHPEEELLYLGGAIPYYAREKQRTVAVACMSYANTTRRSELLNGLWSMGYRYYPIIGDFKTAKAKGVKAAYKTIDSRKGEEVLVSWLADAVARTRPEVLVVCDQVGTPTYTPDLARLLADMIVTDRYGTYHATSGEAAPGAYISWADFCREIYRQAGLDTRVIPVTTAEYGLSRAARPLNSRLDKRKLTEAGFAPLPPWPDALARFLAEAPAD